MFIRSSLRWRSRAVLALTIALLCALSSTVLAFASGGALLKLSSDPYTNKSSQHKTEVEPDNFAYGSTIVSAFQVGRFTDGGSSNAGWATSTDNGTTWKNGFLPATTVYATPKGKYARVSDPSVTYDAKYNTWMISTLALVNINGSAVGAAVLVSRSTDGGLTWVKPVMVAKIATGQFFDKDWIVCDNSSASPFYGHCYVEWDLASSNDLVQMSTSTNGGATWGGAKVTANHASGLGGQPLVQPDGNVIVPFLGSTIEAFTSTNGGTSWNTSVAISTLAVHTTAGNIRTGPLPSAEIDGSGKVYVVWQDCRFESSCSANDIVMSTSTNGTVWSTVTRIPANAVGSGVDHFIPGIGVDKSTSGSTTRLALTYYYYPVANCTITTCQLNVGYISSSNGGTSWSAATTLTPAPMKVTWLANTTGGYMVGDYLSTTFSAGKAYPVFAVATAPGNHVLNENMYTVTGGLQIAGGFNTATSNRVVFTHANVFTLHTAY